MNEIQLKLAVEWVILHREEIFLIFINLLLPIGLGTTFSPLLYFKQISHSSLMQGK